MNSIFKTVLLLIAGAFLIFLGDYYSESKVHLWEDLDRPFTLKGVSDAESGGNSEVKWFKQYPQGVEFAYELGRLKQWAYAGFRVEFANSKDPKDHVNCVDWSHYQHLSMELKSIHNKGFTVQINTLPPDLTAKEEIRMMHQVLSSGPEFSKYKLHLKRFFIPEWVKLQFGLPASGANMELNCVQSIQILSSNYMSRDIEDIVQWQNIYLHQHRTWTLPLSIGIVSASLFFWFLYLIKKSTWEKAVRNNILNQYAVTPEAQLKDQEWERIREYFSEHYFDSDFKLEEVSKAIGISQKRLAAKVKHQLNLSPREYLRELRLNEGARLLCSSTLAINKIAFDLGYNSAAHFNRQFKAKFEMTPKEYRENNSGNLS